MNNNDKTVDLKRRVVSNALWVTPVLTAVALPAHAQMSPDVMPTVYSGNEVLPNITLACKGDPEFDVEYGVDSPMLSDISITVVTADSGVTGSVTIELLTGNFVGVGTLINNSFSGIVIPVMYTSDTVVVTANVTVNGVISGNEIAGGREVTDFALDKPLGGGCGNSLPSFNSADYLISSV